ncbi:TonB-linked SusC/RagA family outer membrane protein [Mariniflexile fucanivorans]|uniref:TonB-linked SusC/RagA family outer membrane protein n=1 Tax=Mariniflexile fucanivorans TaxID=264023 RepID=A0A4R1REI4_9FLAO|nr:SusC/RagA family TonB-linked outer membrane protein [Mariniflexile fucanivorans]TCL64325.1 TonB-linked SusC/RagA family outer membrane protein [Mariniflexile fucanivorans]
MKTKFSGILTLLLAFVVQLTFAQEKTISGTVSDPSGLPLPGATVLVKGTKSGTSTDFDGKYSIKANQGATLVFSFVGYTTKEARIGSSSSINVQLSEDAEALEEVVVTALGIKREKASIGSAITTVNSDQLNEGSQTTMADAIKGKVAGVVISNSSTDPGASSGVIIRGFSSLGGNNQPLYIVDGIPINDGSRFSSSLDGAYDFGRGSGDINPENIESISVLKGASSTALYGSRAANGVILITTKKGKSSKLDIDVSTTMIFSDLLRAPNYQTEFGQGWDGQHYLGENGSWGPRFDNTVQVWGNVVNNSQKLKPYSFQKDQLRNFFDVGESYVTNVAISGGSDNTTGRISVNNSTSDGIYPTKSDSYERNTLTLSFNSKLDFLTFGGSLNYVNTSGSAVASGQGLSVINNLMQIPTDIDITEFKDYKNDPFNSISNYYTPYGVTNPYFTLNEDGSGYLKERVYGAFDVTAEINSWSSIGYRFGIDSYTDNTKVWQAIVKPLPGTPNFGSSTLDEGSYFERTSIFKQFNHDLFYNLSIEANEKFMIESTFGFNYNDRFDTSISSSVSSQDIPDYFALTNSTNTPITSSVINKRRLYGVFNSTTLSYNDMLYITANIRNDWYSTLPVENRSVLYGGVNGSWVATNTFPEIKDVISYAKLRVGYGETGVDTDPYQVNPVIILGNVDNQGFRSLAFPANGTNAYEIGNRAANPDLKPERRKEFEIGTELSFLKNRISIDFTYYDAKVENQILSLPLAASSGYTSQTANIGVISNKGIEALLKLGIFNNPDGFNWDTTLNFSTNDAILEELDDRLDQVSLGGLSTTSLVAREGEPLALIEGSVPKRDDNGNIVVDANGIPVASSEKEVYGDTQYDYTLGISNEFSYKNLSFAFTFDIRQGGLMFSRTADITRFTGNSITTTLNDRQPYIIPGSVQEVSPGVYQTNTTAIDTEHWDDYYRADAIARENVIDKSFVKLREVILSYRFSKKIIGKTPFEDLSISLIGRNLLLFTPESNQFIDPEVSTFGTDLSSQFGEFSANPSTKSLGVTLKARF